MDDAISLAEVLIVDDNEMSAVLAMTYLRKTYKAEFVTDPRKVISQLSSKQYKAILLDIDLGAGIRGEDILVEIRALPNYKSVPVIALTGFSGNNENHTLLELGFNGYLSKPYSKLDLIALMEKLLG